MAFFVVGARRRASIQAASAVGIVLVGLGYALLGLASPSAAQSLADVVRVEAEAFDAGESGIAFFDTDESFGEVRRDTDVDVFERSSASDGALLGRTRDGEFVQYTIDLEAAATFEARLRVASGSSTAGVIHVDVNGERVGSVDGATGAWFDWQIRSAGSIALDAGAQVVQLTWAEGADVNLDWLELAPTSAPITPTATAVPEMAGIRIEAEDFDPFGFEDSDESFGELRTDVDVDVFLRENVGASGDALIGRTRDGDSVQYTVDIPEAGFFTPLLRVASGASQSGWIEISIDGELRGIVTAQTDGWFDWAVRDGAVVELSSGPHTIELRWRFSANVNLDWLELVPREDPCQVGTLEAEDATRIRGRFEVRDDPEASGGQYVVVPRGSGGRDTPGNDSVSLCARVETAGLYRLDARLRVVSETRRSFFVNIGGTPVVFVSDAPVGTFTTDAVNMNAAADPFGQSYGREIEDPVLWWLEPGEHAITFSVRRDGVELDSATLVPVESRPCLDCDVMIETLKEAGVRLPRRGHPCSWDELSVTVTCTDTIPQSVTGLQFSAESLPSGLGSLANLTTLRFVRSGPSPRALSPEIGNLTQLTNLTIENVTSLPAEIGDLDNLENLELNGTDLTALPPEIGDLDNLYLFSMFRAGDLASLPPEIGDLANLRVLNLSRHKITALPPEIGNLDKLERLRVIGGLTSLPAEIGNLESLRQLTLGNSIQRLNDGNRFVRPLLSLPTLPPEIGGLSLLLILELRNTGLTELPPEIGQLTKLRTLRLDDPLYSKWTEEAAEADNQLKTLPTEIGNLVALEELNLRQNLLRGDITALAPLVLEAPIPTMALGDEIGGFASNECLTTTSEELAAVLDSQSEGFQRWDACENP